MMAVNNMRTMHERFPGTNQGVVHVWRRAADGLVYQQEICIYCPTVVRLGRAALAFSCSCHEPVRIRLLTRDWT